MAQVVVLGMDGTDGLWLVDFGAGTVTSINPPSDSELGEANNLRKAGATIVKGVNFAVSVSSASPLGSGFMD